MNLPNALTILRIFFVPLLVAALVQEKVGFQLGDVRVTNDWLSLGIFLVAAGTDLLDGYLARRWKQVTTVGTFRLADGYGSWGSPDPGSVTDLRGARLVSATGAVLATATFTS